MRIIAGTARGIRLDTPRSDEVRPTGDRTREALFSLLVSRGALESETVVLDLFAGTGALALEALSRGAREATLVEKSQLVAAIAKRNAVRTRLAERTRVVCQDVERFLQHAPREPRSLVTLVFCDPPYVYGGHSQVLVALAGSGLLANGATVVVERSHRAPAPAVPSGWSLLDERQWGKAAMTILGCGGDPE